MNKKIISLGLLAASMSFAAPLDECLAALNEAKATIPANALSAKLTLAQAQGVYNELLTVMADDEDSERIPALADNCQKYASIIKLQAETQTLRNKIAENWEKRNATNRSIEAIQEQIASARSGKMSSLAADLEAEKARLSQSKDQEARLQAEMQKNQEKFQAEAAAQEAALKAAGEREAELQQKLAEEQAALEAEKKALAEERAKAEARQQEAMNKLNELQSKMIQVSKDARGIILSMSDILFAVNKADLKQDLKTSLAKVAGILSVYQQFSVSIEGNTDNTGSEEHNMKLSQQRADNVMKFLVDQGIDASRLTAKGLGMTMPIADNSTKEGRQKNRRVDLVIQDKALQAQQPAAEQATPAAEQSVPAAEQPAPAAEQPAK
ncbi:MULTISPECIES: OmpA family protein [unclassified Fibrobacter]|uniref:OmpA family protein n=1 Tax=unclassified Fibrobacter TaxID=2634177 RepID=UPI000D6C6AF6|nr:MULTISPECIES: OmpA family protein [unclassified Fibrobacter]PWJ62525.1 outer membrane protein OmpA-like peptidoglycan-associated protein [Fibrobacter sp. UWR4]PZW67348.1 outer membrane protein OmpA-like peptidoglycan-associated protein [Fibrobacter sp. UWR1]